MGLHDRAALRITNVRWQTELDARYPDNHGGDDSKRTRCNMTTHSRRLLSVVVLVVALCVVPPAHAACCYFSAKNADILQPAQKVFITWDPVKKIETFT